MRRKKHGMSTPRTPEYRSWLAMLDRVRNPRHVRFENYGGRGIAICHQWVSSFEQFFRDMGTRPEGFTLDRIDNDGNYEPTNCRWADWLVQNNNRRPARKRRRATLQELQRYVDAIARARGDTP